MRLNKIVAIASLALAGALAAVPAAAAELRIAVLSGEKVLLQSPLAKAAEARMKADFERRFNELEAEKRKLEEDIAKFRKEADLMAPAERARQEKSLNERQIDFGYKGRQLQDEAGNRQRELMQQMRSQIRDVIAQVVAEKQLDLIIQDPVFASPNVLDITDDVLRRLNAAPAAPVPPAR